MEKAIELIKRHAPREISIPIILQFTILSGMMSLPRIESLLPQGLQKMIIKVPMVSITGTLLLLYIAILGSYFYLYWKYRSKHTAKMGILWGNDREAYCPSCKTLLSNYGVYTVSRNSTYCGFTCVKCNKQIYLTDKGLPVNLEEAKKLIWGDN